MTTSTLFSFAAGAAILGLAGIAGATGISPDHTKLNGNALVVSTAPYMIGQQPESVQGPLQLYYQTTDLFNGSWLYNFTLKNTNIDGSWQAGQSCNWIIFGDEPYPGPSNLDTWVGDNNSLAGTPFANEGFAFSSGGHNGPTLLDFDNNFQGWVPAFVGDSISWSGTANVDIADGDLLWSDIAFGTIKHADFLPAIKVVPAPGAAALLGLAGLASGRRRR